MRAGQLNRRVTLQKQVRPLGVTGQLPDIWEDVGQLWASIANQSGMSAVRAVQSTSEPVSMGNYSFLVRFASVMELRIEAGMRIIYAGYIFIIRGISIDYACRDAAYLICESIA